MNPLGPGDPLRLGPYRLIGVLGEGGMGQVFLGRDSLGTIAAVKVLRREFANQREMADRFVREASTAQAVRSKGVARVLGAQTEGGRPWIATEFLSGPTLNSAVTRYGPLEEPALRALGAALAGTLGEIHAAGLVHRDIKPSNIVLTASGPRVIDFGIARPEHGLTLTTTGQAPVTPGFGAPEQVLGQRTGPSADIFSLGAVLAYAASGEPVFTGGHIAAIQYEVVHGQPQLGGVPDEVRPLIEPCLAKDPAQRPGPEQIARAFDPPRQAKRIWRTGPLAEDISQGEAEARRLAEQPTDAPSERPSRRRALTLLAGGATVAAAAAGTGGWWLLNRESGEDSTDADLLPASAAERGTAPSPLWGPLDQVADPSSPAPLPLGDVVVFGAEGGGVRGHGVVKGERRWSYPRAELSARYLSAHGDLLLVADGSGRLVALDAANGERAWTASAAVKLLLAADDSAVYFLTEEERLRAVELDSRKVRWTVRPPGPGTGKSPARAVAAGGRLVYCGSDGAVTALRADSGKVAWRARGDSQSGPVLPAAADGVVYLGGDELTAVTLSNGRRRWTHPSETLSGDGSGGWTAPTVSGQALYAADGNELHKRSLRGGAGSWVYSIPFPPPPDPPVLQGNSVWVPMDDSGSNGTGTIRASDGREAWRRGAGQEGQLKLAGGGNRVFELRLGNLSAFPVF